MDTNLRHSLSKSKMIDVLGRPPFQVLALRLCTLIAVFIALYLAIDLGGFLGLIALIAFWFWTLSSLALLFVIVTDFFGMRKPHLLLWNKLLRQEVFPDFFMPKNTLATHFLFVDRTLGRLFTSHSNYKEGYPVDDLYQLTCGCKGKDHFMIFRFRSGDTPELHITARTQKDANQQVIRLQNFLGWN